MLELKDKGLDEPPTNKPMWQWQSENALRAFYRRFRLKQYLDTKMKLDRLNEPYEPRNDDYDSPSPF